MSKAEMEAYAKAALPALMNKLASVQAALPEGVSAEELYDSVRAYALDCAGFRLNLDLYESSPDDPVLIFFTGIANYTRFYYVFLSLLSKQGFNVVAIDRPGHGFSDGLRGDCRVEDVAAFLPGVIDWAKATYNDRIGLFGTSLGGITTFYMLPDIQGIKSALCHNWLYPGELADEKKRTLSIVLKLVNKLFPSMMLPIRKLIDLEKVGELSASPEIVDYFLNIASDPIYCQALTLRSVVSYFGGYQPKGRYEDVAFPVRGLISEYEKVLPFETSKAWWARAGFSEDAITVMPEAKHMIFHDRIADVVPVVAEWFNETL